MTILIRRSITFLQFINKIEILYQTRGVIFNSFVSPIYRLGSQNFKIQIQEINFLISSTNRCCWSSQAHSNLRAAVANILVTVDPEIVTVPNMTVVPTPVTCDTKLPSLKAATQTTQYQLAGGAAVNEGAFKQRLTMKSADTVEIQGVLCVAEDLVGKDAEIVVYADYQPLDSEQVQSHYMRDSEGQVQLWDGTDKNLVALESTLIKSQQEVSLYSGVIPITGKIMLYFGYRLADSTLVTNAKAIEVNIEP